jgi:hypothetical protein
VSVCFLSGKISNIFSCETIKVLINTRVIKHLYDRKPAEEFDFVTTHLSELLVKPDQVFANKSSKRGDYVFVRKIGSSNYFCSLEVVVANGALHNKLNLHIATVFRLRKKNYLHNYKLVWSRRGDIPSS